MVNYHCLPGPTRTDLLDHRLQTSHGDDGDPHRHQGAQEITELKHVIVHDAENHNAWLVTGMVELQEQIAGIKGLEATV